MKHQQFFQKSKNYVDGSAVQDKQTKPNKLGSRFIEQHSKKKIQKPSFQYIQFIQKVNYYFQSIGFLYIFLSQLYSTLEDTKNKKLSFL